MVAVSLHVVGTTCIVIASKILWPLVCAAMVFPVEFFARHHINAYGGSERMCRMSVDVVDIHRACNICSSIMLLRSAGSARIRRMLKAS